MLAISQVNAGITLSATRVIFDGKHKEASVGVRNVGNEVLIQSWIDTDTADASTLPFAVTPALVRVEGNEQQLLRIIYEGKGLPTDKESVVWLNVQEIPRASKTQNTLQLAVRQRIKVFFRPVGLKSDAYLAPIELLWNLEDRAGETVLSVNNPGLYHVSIANIKLQSGDIIEHPFDSLMIPPGEIQKFVVKKLSRTSTPVLSFASINDYGAQDQYTAKLSNSSPVQAHQVKNEP